jgi:hypothetical protein
MYAWKEGSLLADTEFKIFARLLATKYRRNRRVEKFAKELFTEIYLPESEDDPVDETLPRTYKAYYYGQNDITELASKISGSLDTANFEQYIQTDSDDTIEYLCDSFKQWYPDIDSGNYCQKIAQRFKDIIDHAAAPKTKDISIVAATIGGVPVVQMATLKEKYGIGLVAETGSVCPNDGCQKSLFTYKDGHTELIYDVAVIDPDVSPDNPSNLIALCPECAAKYAALKKPDDIARMTDIKKSLVEAHDDQEIRSDQHVQEGVRRVIEKIPFITPPVDIDLNYDPVPVKQKISDFSLYLRIKTEVNVYFNDVHEVFQQMGREGRLRFNPFCQQVRYMYVSFRDKGYSQDKIFYEMTKWLFDATHEKWGDCEIVIAYFTQKCEAFDVIA